MVGGMAWTGHSMAVDLIPPENCGKHLLTTMKCLTGHLHAGLETLAVNLLAPKT